jgi:hypothetical protein
MPRCFCRGCAEWQGVKSTIHVAAIITGRKEHGWGSLCIPLRIVCRSASALETLGELFFKRQLACMHAPNYPVGLQTLLTLVSFYIVQDHDVSRPVLVDYIMIDIQLMGCASWSCSCICASRVD